MKIPLVILLIILLKMPAFSQYKIHSQTFCELQKKTLAILVDEGDTLKNQQVKAVFSQYWKLNSSIILCTSKEMPLLMRTGDYVFLRHQARITSDDKTATQNRTDYLSLFSNEFLGDDIALCYTNSESMNQNLVNLKFYINAIQQAVLFGEETDSSNISRNTQGLSELRQHTLFIPADLLENRGVGNNFKRRKNAHCLKPDEYAFKSAIISHEQLNKLIKVDTEPIFIANVVNLPDYHHYLYVCEVNTGRIIYKNELGQGYIKQISIRELNNAIMKTCLQGSIANRFTQIAVR